MSPLPAGRHSRPVRTWMVSVSEANLLLVAVTVAAGESDVGRDGVLRVCAG